MEGLRVKKYLHTTRKRFDPFAMLFSLVGLVGVIMATGVIKDPKTLIDTRSMLIVVGGTVATLLFQFDFGATFHSLLIVVRSFFGTPDGKVSHVIKQLDDAIVNDKRLPELRDGLILDGELLNDIVYMYHQGLLFEEIDEFVTSRISDSYLQRQIAVSFLQRAAVIAPALGLFGTIIGLIGVLKSLTDPTQIGPSMSLALMTTAYGAGLGSLVFTPLAGRIEHHNTIYLEVHKQLMSKVGVLLTREERKMTVRGDDKIVA